MGERARSNGGRASHLAGRLLRLLLSAVLGAAVLYLVAMNVFLRTGLFRSLIGADPESMTVEYTSAYSILPGHIHAENLRIRGRDSHVEWVLAIDRCDFDVSFVDFVHRKFHASDIDADGVSLRLRQREPAFTLDEAAALPPIPGFADPPISGPPQPPITDADYDLVTIQLDGVHARHVREVWIDTVRYKGDFDIRGRWFLKPVRWLYVGPATLDARNLEVFHGPAELWASGASAHLEVTVHPYDVRVPRGADVLHQVSVSGDLHAVVHVPPVTRQALGERAQMTRGEVPLDAHLRIDRGVIHPGTHLRADAFRLAARAEELDFQGELQADVRVDAQGVARAAIEGRDLTVAQESFTRGRVARVDSQLRSRDLDLAHPFADASYAVDVEGAETDSCRYWWQRAQIGRGLVFDSGRASASAHAEGVIAKRAVRVSAHGEVHDVVLGKARARLLVPRLALAANDVVLAPGKLTGHASVDAPELDTPSLGDVASLGKPPRDLRVQGSARGAAKADIDLGERTASGTASLVARGLRLQLGKEALQGALSAHVVAKANAAFTDLAGSTVDFRADGHDAWWANARLTVARLTLDHAPGFVASVVVHAKDASPVTSLVESRVPMFADWAIAAIPTKDLSASGDILVGPGGIEARSVRARGDGFGMGLEYAKLGPQKELAMLLELGSLQAGVGMSNGKTDVYLFGAEPWFAAQAASLRALERRYE